MKEKEFKAIHSARYLLEDYYSEEGIKYLSGALGLPEGVISSALKNIFPDEDFDWENKD